VKGLIGTAHSRNVLTLVFHPHVIDIDSGGIFVQQPSVLTQVPYCGESLSDSGGLGSFFRLAQVRLRTHARYVASKLVFQVLLFSYILLRHFSAFALLLRWWITCRLLYDTHLTRRQ
jgi:hypothetical protein